ncbi:hypothetical protein ACI3KS_09005 [Microbacterium sp. ZW T5_45]|uniref:hypothetical protein n=1 Tax=Microbacterium sp. ZW T5_45 TaxID=3378080 RepID=UPI0038553F33
MIRAIQFAEAAIETTIVMVTRQRAGPAAALRISHQIQPMGGTKALGERSIRLRTCRIRGQELHHRGRTDGSAVLTTCHRIRSKSVRLVRAAHAHERGDQPDHRLSGPSSVQLVRGDLDEIRERRMRGYELRAQRREDVEELVHVRDRIRCDLDLSSSQRDRTHPVPVDSTIHGDALRVLRLWQERRPQNGVHGQRLDFDRPAHAKNVLPPRRVRDADAEHADVEVVKQACSPRYPTQSVSAGGRAKRRVPGLLG